MNRARRPATAPRRQARSSEPAKATAAKSKVATSQIALPEDACSLVYETSGYLASVRRFAQTSLTRDNVFGDDSAARQLGTVSGDVKSGMAVDLPVTVTA